MHYILLFPFILIALINHAMVFKSNSSQKFWYLIIPKMLYVESKFKNIQCPY